VTLWAIQKQIVVFFEKMFPQGCGKKIQGKQLVKKTNEKGNEKAKARGRLLARLRAKPKVKLKANRIAKARVRAEKEFA